MERIDRLAIRRRKRHMGSPRRGTAYDPEVRLALHTEAGDVPVELHQQLVAQRPECLDIKRLAPLVVCDFEREVVDHYAAPSAATSRRSASRASACASIWRTRSRVIPNARPISSSDCGSRSPFIP